MSKQNGAFITFRENNAAGLLKNIITIVHIIPTLSNTHAVILSFMYGLFEN